MKKWLTAFLIPAVFWLVQPEKLIGQGCNSSGVLLEWNFNSPFVQCNGAVGYTEDLTTPWLKAGKRSYCPNINAGCGKGLLGSKGHANTDQFEGAICLLAFHNNAEALNRGGCIYDENSSVFDPNQCNNLSVEYIVPVGKKACLTAFSLNIIQKQVSNAPNFEKQGVAVKKNGVLIYSTTQNITAAFINNMANPMVFNFSGDQFCSDGSAEVKFEILFGLVHKIVPVARATGYDNIKVMGTCGGPAFSAQAIPATCGASGPNTNGSIILSGYQATDHYDYTVGASYTGGLNYGSAPVVPPGGIIVSNLPNPATSQSYTIRIFAASGCTIDKTVLLKPAQCPPPVCPKPSGFSIMVTQATCNSNTPNNNAQIVISGVTNGNRAAIYEGTPYSGVKYSLASNLTAGGITFSPLPNPLGSQIYTIRIYNGGDGCFVDTTATLNSISCGPCKNAVVEVIESGADDPDSSPNNGDFAEDDITSYTLCKDTKRIDLELTKSVTPNSGTTCPISTVFTWTLTLTNTGDMTASDIQVSDVLPDELDALNWSASSGTFGPLSGWLLNSLDPGQSETVTFTTQANTVGTITNCAEVNTAYPENDIDSTPGNNSSNEDDDDCASMTVSGNTAPVVNKLFSPELTKPNTPTRLILKIWNNHTVPITTTAAFVDNLPSAPAQVVVATPANLVSTLTGVIATNGDNKITIPSGTLLPVGLSLVEVDVIFPSNGDYCNTINADDLQTNVCGNVLPDTACVVVNSTFVMAPIINKSFTPNLILTGQNSTLIITVDNRNTVPMTLDMPFSDYLPGGLFINGSITSTCGSVTGAVNDTVFTLAANTVLQPGTCTISVPVTTNLIGCFINKLPMNAMIVDVSGSMTGNEDIPQAQLCSVSMLSCQITITSNAVVPQNPVCLDNGTPAIHTDNRIRFSANVTNTNTTLTAYNVSINGGTTITPNTNVPYGLTQFTLGPGTGGGGATFTITIMDSTTPGCTQTFQVTDPGGCNNTTPCPTPKCGTAVIQVNGN